MNTNFNQKNQILERAKKLLKTKTYAGGKGRAKRSPMTQKGSIKGDANSPSSALKKSQNSPQYRRQSQNAAVDAQNPRKNEKLQNMSKAQDRRQGRLGSKASRQSRRRKMTSADPSKNKKFGGKGGFGSNVSSPKGPGFRNKGKQSVGNARKGAGKGKAKGGKKSKNIEKKLEMEAEGDKEFEEFLKRQEEKAKKEADELLNVHDMILGQALESLTYKDNTGYQETKTEKEYKQRFKNKGKKKKNNTGVAQNLFEQFGIKSGNRKKPKKKPASGMSLRPKQDMFKKKQPKGSGSPMAKKGFSSRPQTKTSMRTVKARKGISDKRRRSPLTKIGKKKTESPFGGRNSKLGNANLSLKPSMTRDTPAKDPIRKNGRKPAGAQGVTSSFNFSETKNRLKQSKPSNTRISKNFTRESYLDGEKEKGQGAFGGKRGKRKSTVRRKKMRYVGKKTFVGKVLIDEQEVPIEDPRHPMFNKEVPANLAKQPTEPILGLEAKSNNLTGNKSDNFNNEPMSGESPIKNNLKGSFHGQLSKDNSLMGNVIGQPHIFSNLHIVNSNVYFPIMNPNQQQGIYQSSVVTSPKEGRAKMRMNSKKKKVRRRFRSQDNQLSRKLQKGRKKSKNKNDQMSFEVVEKSLKFQSQQEQDGSSARKRLNFDTSLSKKIMRTQAKGNAGKNDSYVMLGGKNKKYRSQSRKIRLVKSLKSSAIFSSKGSLAKKAGQRQKKQKHKGPKRGIYDTIEVEDNVDNVSFEVSQQKGKNYKSKFSRG